MKWISFVLLIFLCSASISHAMCHRKNCFASRQAKSQNKNSQSNHYNNLNNESQQITAEKDKDQGKDDIDNSSRLTQNALTPDRYFIISRDKLAPYQKIAPGLIWGALIDLETIRNLGGGINRRSVNDYSGNVGMLLDTEEAHLWRGGEFTFILNALTTNGFEPYLAGEVQTASNLWSYSGIRISELAYSHKFNKCFLLRAGILDFSNFFDISTEASTLANYAYSTNPTLYSNFFLSTGPYWGFGGIGEIFNEDTILKLGLFQGNPRQLETALREGFFAVAELGKLLIYEIRLKVGLWRYEQSNRRLGGSSEGLYGILEKGWDIRKRHMGVFLQWGLSPNHSNPVLYALSTGINFLGPFPLRPNDRLSFGIARTWVKERSPETSYEATYAIEITKHFILQPDLQYFTHTAFGRKNCWMGLLRLHIDV